MSNRPPIRIVIGDADAAFRKDVSRSLESELGIHIVGEACDADGAVELARKNRADILLVDFALAQKCEPKVLRELATQLGSLRVVVTVTAMAKGYLVESFRLGARGVVLKRSTPEVLFKSMRSVMAGQYWLERESVSVLVEALRESLAHGNGGKSPRDYGLTRREVDIITKIANGRLNKEVGEEFAISERTVKHHLTNIFGKLGVSSRLQLALFAVNQHLTASSAPSLTLQAAQPDEEV